MVVGVDSLWGVDSLDMRAFEEGEGLGGGRW